MNECDKELIEYNASQIEEMKKHKWILSEKRGYDVGEEALIDWINRFSEVFREEYYKVNK
jgi:hypothetical protein